MELWVNEGWLLLTAVIFTVLGYSFGMRAKLYSATESTIDALIEQGYLKTKGFGKDVEILTWKEWCDDQSTGKNS